MTTNQFADLLVRHGIVPASAVDDAEGYDNSATLDGIRAACAEILLNFVMWKTGTPPVEEGGSRRYWCAVKGSNGKIAHRLLEYLNRHVMPVSDQCEPSDDAEPVPDSDGDYYWTGWYEGSCDQCETQWRYSGEVVAWMALPKLKIGPNSSRINRTSRRVGRNEP